MAKPTLITLDPDAKPILELSATVRRTRAAYKNHQVSTRNRILTLQKRKYELTRDYRKALQFLSDELTRCKIEIRSKPALARNIRTIRSGSNEK